MTIETKYLIERYYQVQKHRIELSNQIFALNKDGENTNPIKEFYERFYDIEKDIAKYIKKVVQDHKMWPWLKEIKGIGPVLGSILLTTIDITKAQHASSVWKYAGLAPGQKKIRGEKLDFNPFLKMSCWKIGEAFVKTRGKYRGIYDSSKDYYHKKFPEKKLLVDKNGKPILTREKKKRYLYTDGHIHAMAKRRTVKLFLSEFWAEWRKMEGLEVSVPFAHRGE